MSAKHPKPKDPAKKKTTREDVINFMNYISTDENFCLRVWNTVQGVHERALKEAEMAERAGRNVVTEEFEQFPEAVPADGGEYSTPIHFAALDALREQPA